MYPDSKSNYDVMYSRLLLFFPLKSESELNENNLKEMYTRLTDDQDETIVNHNERKLFPMKIHSEGTRQCEKWKVLLRKMNLLLSSRDFNCSLA